LGVSLEVNKALVRRYFEELASQGKLDVADELFGPSFGQSHPERFPAEVPPGPERGKFIWATWRAAFPDWQVEILDLLAEGERVAARIAASGTHRGELRRPAFTVAPPTGERISVTGTVWFTFQDGRIADIEETHNLGAALQRLGIRRVGEPDPEANKAVVRRLIEDVWNRANPAAADEIIAPDRLFAGRPAPPQVVREASARVVAARPDHHVIINDLVAEGDKVAVWWTARGTHLGEYVHPVFGRLAPTGKPLTINGLAIHRVAGGKLVVSQVGMAGYGKRMASSGA
jgi:predicted ester cyclase